MALIAAHEVVVCVHCLVTLSLTMTFIASHFNAGVILVATE